MNTFWDLVDWLLPPVRIVDDLADGPSESSYRRPTHHHSSRRLSGKDHDTDRERDRDRDRARDRERDRRREKHKERERGYGREGERDRARDKEGRISLEKDMEREQLRHRVQALEHENERLLEQLRSTREELSKLSTAVFPSPNSLTPQSLAVSYSASPPDALGLIHPIPPALALARSPSPIPSTTPTSSTYPSISQQHSAEAALSDPKRLRLLYSSLRATYSDARQTILSQAEELASLKGFLSKTDDWSGAQLLQALADLNSEIIQLSASVAEEFAANLRVDTRVPVVAKERDREIVGPALGKEMIKLLESREHAQDPTLVQHALQAWEVWCVTRVMDAFCYGLPKDVDESLRRIFDRMQREEPQPTTSRWRALTYKHARSLLTRPTEPSEPSSPDTAAPVPFNSAASSIASASSLPPPLLSLTEANLRGVLAILALAGCTDSRGLHRDPLRTSYGSALSRISARAERISSVMKEGVLSGLFEVVWCPPCRGGSTQKPKRPTSSPGETSSVQPPLEINIEEIGANRGKGKEREWVKEVERARKGVDDDGEEEEEKIQVGERDEGGVQAPDQMFDWRAMDNIYAGHGNERCRVLCTLELGLAFSRRLPEEEREESVDGDGMVVSNGGAGFGSRPTSRISATSSLSKPVSMGGVGLEGMANGNLSMGSSGGRTVDANRMVRNLLLKPKVLLESVVDIL